MQKNYFLHQSAKDGYRSYLQSYASYSLKKIFDVNALDLAKVGKAFGFSVPPRVNVSIGGGKGGAGKSGKKRARDDDDDEEEATKSEGELDGGDAASGKDVEQMTVRHQARRKEKRKRVEILGQKKAGKEVNRSGKDRQKEQWSR